VHGVWVLAVKYIILLTAECSAEFSQSLVTAVAVCSV